MIYKDKEDKVHELKILHEYFNDIYFESKTFEIRKDDRGFKCGDVLRLRELSENIGKSCEDMYTGRELFVSVNYIERSDDYCKQGYCVLGLET